MTEDDYWGPDEGPSVREKVDSQARASREERERAVDVLRRYGSWILALFVLLPLSLATILSLAGVAVYLITQAISKRKSRA